MRRQSNLFKAVVVMLFAFSLLPLGCGNTSPTKEQRISENTTALTKDTQNTEEETIMSQKIHIKIGGRDFIAKLENNPTAQAFAEKLPLTLSMQELNGNEKYARLSEQLPTNDKNPRQIHTGDLMLYGSDCVVLFYKDFSTGYSYTRLGHIENPDNLKDIVGNGDIEVIFEP